LWTPGKPAKRLSIGDIVRFGGEGRLCFLEQLDATVEAKGEGGERDVSLASKEFRPGPRPFHRASRAPPSQPAPAGGNPQI